MARIVVALALVLVAQTPADVGGTSPLVRSPRVQLGDAPLSGYPGSEHDRVTVLWETDGSVPGEHFEASVRRLGSDPWTDVGPVSVERRDDGRVAYEVVLAGLAWDTEYEYRIRRLVDDRVTGSWGSGFRTRREAGDSNPFSFAAYGDSAAAGSLEVFDAVQARIAASGASFTLLLGDNAYGHGTRREVDMRFGPTGSPASAALVAGHLEYVAFGNHDVHSARGRPIEEAFAAPVPVSGVTARVAPPPGERSEHNYSFDHGNAHFVTFDSNAIGSPARLDALLDWVIADLAASEATWKIVFIHHPIGVPDKEDELALHPYYARRLIRSLTDAGVDLVLAGHSHTFSWSYPLSGVTRGIPTFTRDDDGEYRQGDGVVQVVSGVGGHSIRDVTYDAPFVAASFTAATEPAGEFGFALVSVAPLELTVEYVSAADGRVIAGFSIVIPVPAFGHGLNAR